MSDFDVVGDGPLLRAVAPMPQSQPTSPPEAYPTAARVVHMPADPSYFRFDAAVAGVFDNMAVNSIPGYRYFWDRVRDTISQRALPKWTQVWDMGVSTGAGLEAVKLGARHPFLEYFGTDISEPMLEKAKQRAPFATMFDHDLTKGLPSEVEKGQVSVFLFGWTLQFLGDIKVRQSLLADCAQALHEDGLIFIGEKYTLSDPEDQEVSQNAYIDWRMSNGYTYAEIKSKSRALEAAMHPWSHEDLQRVAELLGLKVRPLYRQYNFGGYLLHR